MAMIINKFYKRVCLTDGFPEALSKEWILNAIRSLPQYESGSKYDLEAIDINLTRPLCTSVTSDRLKTAEILLERYAHVGLDPYIPLRLSYDILTQDIIPPIAVKISDEYIVCDGTHRLFAAKQAGLKTVSIITIIGSRLRLPGRPTQWRDVSIVDVTPPMSQKFINFQPDQFTQPFTVAANSTRWWTFKK